MIININCQAFGYELDKIKSKVYKFLNNWEELKLWEIIQDHNLWINISKEQLKYKVILHFEGSDYITKVWINGKYVGMNKCGYSRFSFKEKTRLSD